MKKKHVVRQFLVMLLAVCMLVGLFSVNVMAAGENSKVQEAKNGVVQVVVTVKDKNNNYRKVQGGTGFLINERNVVTCEHVISLDDATIAMIREQSDFSGYKASDIKNRVQIKISVVRDVTLNAKIKTVSKDMDIAVLELEQAIDEKVELPIRESNTVKQTEDCFALGFPAIVSQVDNIATYTSDDVMISNGKVFKVSSVNTTNGPIEYVITNTKIDKGSSGGPLVDAEGNVIGISQSSVSSNEYDDGYFYSIASDQLLAMIKPLGISYTPAGYIPPVNPIDSDTSSTDSEPENTPTPRPEPRVNKTALQSAISLARGKVAGDYTKESFDAMTEALAEAEAVYNSTSESQTQEQVDAAATKLQQAFNALKGKEEGLPLMLIIGIAAAVVVILIIILIIVMSKKKAKPAPKPMPSGGMAPPAGGGQPPFNGGASVPPVSGGYGGSAGTSVLGGSSSATTVLNAGSSETTVLGGANYGKLVRKKTGEEVTINSESFKVGTQRAAVDYCISDNTNVSRVHAVIKNSGGNAFVKDNNSTNGTFVNGVRIQKNGQSPLNNGDTLELADEKFTYKA